MTKLLQTRSEKKVNEISPDEIEAIKRDISLVVSEIRSLPFSQAKKKLLNLRFGGTQNSILHLAAKFDNIEAAQDILQMSSNDLAIIDSRNYNQYTPLHFVAIDGDLEVAKLLINAGADRNPVASERRRRWTPMHHAAKYNNIKIVELLLSYGVDQEVRTYFGLTPLIIAAEFGHIEILDLFLKRGANKNAQTIEDNDGMNALHYATVDGHLEAVDHLLSAGVDRDSETYSGFSALDFAAKIDNVKITNLLLSWGVGNVEHALAVAKDRGSKKVRILLEKHIEAKARLFNKKWLRASEHEFLAFLRGFNERNLTEAIFPLSKEILLNAYGVMSLKKESGFLVKKAKTLRATCLENNVISVADEISRIRNIASKRSFKIPFPDFSSGFSR